MKLTGYIQIFSLSILSILSCTQPSPKEAEAVEVAEIHEFTPGEGLPPTDTLDCVESKVRSGQFFSSVLAGAGLNAKDSYDISQACSDVFDVRNLHAGNSYRVYYTPSSHQPQYLVYDKDRVTSVVFSCRGPILPGMYPRKLRWSAAMQM